MPDVKQSLAMMFAALPPAGGTNPAQLALYLHHLSDLPPHAVCLAIDRLIKTAKWTPKIAEIRQETLALLQPQTLAAEAWDEVQREIARVGTKPLPVLHGGTWYQAPQPHFSSPAITQAVQSMGWERICTSEQPGITRAQFLKTYEAYADRISQALLSGQVPALEESKEDSHAQLPGGL